MYYLEISSGMKYRKTDENDDFKIIMRKILHTVILAVIIGSPLFVVLPRLSTFTARYYTEEVYKNLERTFNTSQYRQKYNPGIIPDESVFSYVSGAYLRGMDPIMANSEITPLGKYFLALSILIFKNDRSIILFFAVASGLSIC